MMQKIPICSVSDIEVGKKKRIVMNGKALMVVHIDNQFYVTDDTCTHGQASLAAGTLEDHEVECPRHGGRFDVRTGEAKTLPAVTPLTTYKVLVEDGEIFIEMEGESNNAQTTNSEIKNGNLHDQGKAENFASSQESTASSPEAQSNKDNAPTSKAQEDESEKPASTSKPPFEVICENGVCRIVRPPKK